MNQDDIMWMEYLPHSLSLSFLLLQRSLTAKSDGNIHYTKTTALMLYRSRKLSDQSMLFYARKIICIVS